MFYMSLLFPNNDSLPPSHEIIVYDVVRFIAVGILPKSKCGCGNGARRSERVLEHDSFPRRAFPSE